MTLSTENLETAWRQSKDNCLTAWCDITEVSDGQRRWPPLPARNPSRWLPPLPLPRAQARGFPSKPASSQQAEEQQGEAELISLTPVQRESPKVSSPASSLP